MHPLSLSFYLLIFFYPSIFLFLLSPHCFFPFSSSYQCILFQYIPLFTRCTSFPRFFPFFPYLVDLFPLKPTLFSVLFFLLLPLFSFYTFIDFYFSHSSLLLLLFLVGHSLRMRSAVLLSITKSTVT